VNPTPDDLDLEVERFRRKLEAGAQFAMTQIVYDVDYLDRFVELIGGEWPIPILVGVFPATSYRLALRLHNEVPGIVVPDKLQKELEQAGNEAFELGLAHAREVVAQSRDRAAGVYLVAPFRQPARVLELID
jgi:methionine synthase / methylenetetrahydrofolate reductase(NADPH)